MQSGSPRRETEHFFGLDLLRGVSALAVLVLHLPWPSGVRPPLPRGYLAVDLFFVLSGFVIAHTYAERLGTAKRLKNYCVARTIRLYPLYGVATLFAAAEMFAYPYVGSGSSPDVTAPRVMSSLATAIVFLPTPPGLSAEPQTLFPLLFPAWSLFWELLVNLIYGVSAARLRPRLMGLLMTVGAIGVMLGEYRYGTAEGPGWDGAWAGGARAVFSFFCGVLLNQLRPHFPAPRAPVVVLAGALLLAFVPGKLDGAAYDVGCTIVLFPLLVWLGADASMSPRVRTAAALAGLLSYPIYVFQAPLLLLCNRMENLLAVGASVRAPIDAAVIIFVSWLVARSFDTPIRRWLRQRFLADAPVPGAETAP